MTDRTKIDGRDAPEGVSVPNPPRILQGLSEISDNFSVVLMDIWGVLHEGDGVFPEALACLEALKKQGKRVVLFSNAPRTAGSIQRVLRGMGLEPTGYDAILSSGDHVRHCFVSESSPYQDLGTRFYHVGDAGHDILDDTHFESVPLMQEASFVLLTGPKKGVTDPEVYEEMWQEAEALALPVVCANSDPYVIIRGQHVLCAGTVGAMYAQMGGKVFWHGKPHASFYTYALETLQVSQSEILAVGDSMWTDIEGAAQAGLTSVLVTHTGVHQNVFVENKMATALNSFLAGHEAQPTYVLERLQWLQQRA